MNSPLTAMKLMHNNDMNGDRAHEAHVNNDDEASSRFVSINGAHVVQSHVHGDEAHDAHEQHDEANS
jgi:hypothetical protein